MTHRSLLPFALLILPTLAASRALPAQEADPPSKRETQALVEEYLSLGPRAVAAARERQLAILARLELLEPLDRRGESDWRKELLELWMDGPELEDSGRNFLWEDEERGLYIVNGRTRRPAGLLIGMHGGGVGVGDAGPMASGMSSGVSSNKWVGIFPEVLEKTERGWTDSGTEEFVLELIDRAIRTFEVDPNRVYLSGHSMGGYGTWTLGAHHADRCAGLAASAGGPTPILDRATNAIVDIDWGVVPNLRNVRTVVYQSVDDPQVPPDVNQFAVARVAEAAEQWGGYEAFEYWEVDGRGHGAPPGGYEALFEKIADTVRDPKPAKIVWQPVLDWKRQFYWLRWERPVAGAVVVAELDREANAVLITADRPLEGFSVLLDEQLLDLERPVTVQVGGRVVFEGPAPAPTLATLLATGVTGDPGRTYAIELRW